MKRAKYVAIALALASPAAAQQAGPGAPSAPQCPDYSRELATAVQAFGARDACWQAQVNLDKQVTELKKQLSDAEAKVKVDDEMIKSLRAAGANPPVAKPEAKPEAPK